MRSTTGVLSGAGRLFALLVLLVGVVAVPSRALAQQPEPASAEAGQPERT